MRWWKVLGLAGLVGVAASGAVIARAERRRRAYSPEEIRERLQARLAAAGAAPAPPPAAPPPGRRPLATVVRSRAMETLARRRSGPSAD